MTRLTDTKVRKLTKPGLYSADTTLYIRVSKTGGKSWIQRIIFNDERHDIGLGGWPVVTVDDAKEQALANRRLIRSGGNPLTEKRKAKMPTFREANNKVLEVNKANWRNKKTLINWQGGMQNYAFPVFGDKPIDEIGREDVLKVLTSIWSKKPGIAKPLRQRIRKVFDWAQAHNYIEANPADDRINGALPKLAGVKKNFRSLNYREVGEALIAIEHTGSSQAAKLCFQFIILTAARSGEARGASWNEIDMDAREWRIPASRMKTGIEHRVPLSNAAMVLLEKAKELRGDSGLLFPSPMKPKSQISNDTLFVLLRNTGLAEKATVHGFRSTFRSWAAERTNTPREVAEMALAHAVKGVEGVYQRSDLFDRRRLLMDSWAEFATGQTAKVVRMTA